MIRDFKNSRTKSTVVIGTFCALAAVIGIENLPAHFEDYDLLTGGKQQVLSPTLESAFEQSDKRAGFINNPSLERLELSNTNDNDPRSENLGHLVKNYHGTFSPSYKSENSFNQPSPASISAAIVPYEYKKPVEVANTTKDLSSEDKAKQQQASTAIVPYEYKKPVEVANATKDLSSEDKAKQQQTSTAIVPYEYKKPVEVANATKDLSSEDKAKQQQASTAIVPYEYKKPVEVANIIKDLSSEDKAKQQQASTAIVPYEYKKPVEVANATKDLSSEDKAKQQQTSTAIVPYEYKKPVEVANIIKDLSSEDQAKQQQTSTAIVPQNWYQNLINTRDMVSEMGQMSQQRQAPTSTSYTQIPAYPFGKQHRLSPNAYQFDKMGGVRQNYKNRQKSDNNVANIAQIARQSLMNMANVNSKARQSLLNAIFGHNYATDIYEEDEPRYFANNMKPHSYYQRGVVARPWEQTGATNHYRNEFYRYMKQISNRVKGILTQEAIEAERKCVLAKNLIQLAVALKYVLDSYYAIKRESFQNTLALDDQSDDYLDGEYNVMDDYYDE